MDDIDHFEDWQLRWLDCEIFERLNVSVWLPLVLPSINGKPVSVYIEKRLHVPLPPYEMFELYPLEGEGEGDDEQKELQSLHKAAKDTSMTMKAMIKISSGENYNCHKQEHSSGENNKRQEQEHRTLFDCVAFDEKAIEYLVCNPCTWLELRR